MKTSLEMYENVKQGGAPGEVSGRTLDVDAKNGSIASALNVTLQPSQDQSQN